MKAHFEKETGLWVITHGSKWGKEQFVGKTFADALGLFCRTIDARRAKIEALLTASDWDYIEEQMA